MFYTNVHNTKSKLFHVGYNDIGEKFIREESYEPHLGTITNDKSLATKMTYHGESVEIKKFTTIKDFYDYKKTYADLFSIYDDIEPAYQFINDEYPDKIKYDLNKMCILFYDIETAKVPETDKYSPPWEAEGAITSIAIKDIISKNIWCLSTERMYVEQMEIEYSGKLHYKYCSDEIELLSTFVKLINKLKPDMLSAFNGNGFDDAYTINRCNLVLGTKYTKNLSPVKGKVESTHRLDEEGKDVYRNKIAGLPLVDFMLLYQKNVGKYESNSLSFVAGVELGEDKVSYEEYDNLEELRLKNPQKFVEYNIIDVELLDKINSKRKLLELVIAVAYFTKSNFDDVISPIKTWDNFIYSYLNKRNITIPPRKSTVKPFKIAGGYVKKDVVPNSYKNVISLDLKALYPSLSITLNISPDTLVETDNVPVNMVGIDNKILKKQYEHTHKDLVLTGNGYMYRKDKQGFYPALFQLLMDERDVAKKEKLRIDSLIQSFKGSDEDKKLLTDEYSNLHTFEQAVKLLSNSGYGILANANNRYFDPRLASSITLSGQLAIKSASDVVEDYLEKKYNKINTLRFTHTDSCFISLDGICNTTDEADQFYKNELDPIITKCYSDLCEYLNSYKNLLILKREKICSHFLISAPARYACLITDKEGVRYKEPKLEITGMEIVRSSTPKVIKPYLKETLIKMMKEDNVLEYIKEVKKKFYKLSPEEIAFPRSANNLSKWLLPNGSYKGGCPIGVRAALNFNRFITDNQLEMNPIVEGDKIKFIYMKTPNPFRNQNVMGFIRKFVGSEYNKYIDYKTQFDKVYYDVIVKIAYNINLDLNKDQQSLEDIF